MQVNSESNIQIENIQVGTKIGFRSASWKSNARVWYTITELFKRVANPSFVADGRETPAYTIHVECVAQRTGKPWKGTLYLYKGNLSGTLHKINDWNERAARQRHQEHLHIWPDPSTFEGDGDCDREERWAP